MAKMAMLVLMEFLLIASSLPDIYAGKMYKNSIKLGPLVDY